MKLIDRYVREVVRRLPAKECNDIGRELWSTMEDLLPEGYSEEEERELVMKFGDPAVLAGKYRGHPKYLIGPRFFDGYLKLLKLIIPIVVTVVLVVLIITTIFSNVGEASIFNVIGRLIGDSISAAMNVVIGVFFWVTLVFVIFEWVDNSNRAAGKPPLPIPEKGWTPEQLEASPTASTKKGIARSEPIFHLIWTAVWVSVYFNADRLLGIYEGEANGIQMVTPIFSQSVLLSYWPLVLLIALLQVVFGIWKWMRRRWDLKLAALNLVVQTLSVLAFFLIFMNPAIFAEDFLAWLEEVFGSLAAMNWIIGGIIFGIALFAVIDVIQGFRKAVMREESFEESWKS